MTPQEHARELKRLENLRGAKRAQSKRPEMTLAEKLAVHAEVKALDEQIFQHKLNYHELVPLQGIEAITNIMIAADVGSSQV